MMLDFLRTLTMGGPVMIPLAACSLISITAIIERALFYHRASADTQRLMQQVRAAVERGDLAYAESLCDGTPGPVAGVLAAGLRAARRGRDATRAMEEHAMAELPYINRRLSVLDTVVTLAPLLGLLGTVTGMIRSFHIVSRVGMSHPTGITAGIAEALIATATGLVIAIYSLVAYNHFLDRVKHLVSEIEMRATQLATDLDELRSARRPPAADERRDTERIPAAVIS
jgi:biopolymer transport protein ExbB